ncbi:MAG: lysylphosphatidylglycerol synthase transmembrane domain-containing protein [Acidobacteriota bacterium]
MLPVQERSSDPIGPAQRSGFASTFLKVGITVALYALVAYKVDLGTIAARLRTVQIGWVLLGVVVYIAGQWLSAYKWWLLLRPVKLVVPYIRIVGFYFIGMFFNIFLPTIVGGDAVKTIVLARETGALAKSTMSVFMERNVGLFALLTIATIAAAFAPHVAVLRLSLLSLSLLLFAAFIVANLVLINRHAYRLVDYLIAMTPLARIRSRATSLYDAVVPYRGAGGVIAASVGVSFIFQAIVILVVFLNAKALAHDVPVSALAVFVPLISLAGMLPLSVNGLGIREVLYSLLFGQIGIPADVAVSMALLYAVVTLLASLPGGIVSMMQPRPDRRTARRVR